MSAHNENFAAFASFGLFCGVVAISESFPMFWLVTQCSAGYKTLAVLVKKSR